MTDSDAPKPDKAPDKANAKSEAKQNAPETSAADAENNLQEPTEAPAPASPEQAAMDMMAALCRDFGLPDITSGQPAIDPPQQQPTETAFQIIQRFLLDGNDSGNAYAPASSANLNAELQEAYGGPDSADMASPQTMNEQDGPDTSQTDTMQTGKHDSRPAPLTDAQWGVTATHGDGSTTDLQGPVIRDDMFRTAMPSLRGKTTADAAAPDWQIRMEQGVPLSPPRTPAHTAIAARLHANDVPQSLREWCLHAGPSSDGLSELSVSRPSSQPSHLRAVLFDTMIEDTSAPHLSEVPTFSGGPYAIHLEQTIGAVSSETIPNRALIRLVFADRAPIPVELDYIGALPSPLVAGTILIGPNHTIPFWLQITPPSGNDKGVGLVVLVRYDRETGFDVTAQLLSETRTSTPTAILSCSAQSDNSACRAASMIANSTGRLESSLTGLSEIPDENDLEKYGFVLSPPTSRSNTPVASNPKDDAPTGKSTAASTTPSSSAKKAPARKSTNRATKGKASGTSNSNTKGDT